MATGGPPVNTVPSFLFDIMILNLLKIGQQKAKKATIISVIFTFSQFFVTTAIVLIGLITAVDSTLPPLTCSYASEVYIL